MGMAPIAHVLFSEEIVITPKDPKYLNRDRFVLSNGHACALQYTMLHLMGFEQVTKEQCAKFRQLDSVTPGHPENFVTDGVEVSTGPLGQGISNAVGMAMAEAHLAATFNQPDYPIFDHYTYVFCGDGCLQEGVSSEACSLAGHLGLGKLIVFYDDNKITIDGHTELSFTEDVKARYESYGWQVLVIEEEISEEQSLMKLREMIALAKAEVDKPTMIKINTMIGWGSSKANSHSVHGAPLGKEDLANCKKKYGLNPDEMFQVDGEVKALYEARIQANEDTRAAWNVMFAKYKAAFPKEGSEIERRFASKLPDGILDKLPTFEYGKDKAEASRKYSAKCINSVAADMSELIGGSADLTPSNLTNLTCSGDFQKGTYKGRYIRFGVREHGMSAICNGLFAYGGLRPFCATFFNFVGYALGAIRVSALSKFGIIYVMTHDSIGLGEDGPTHQPVEMFESIRSMPNINLFRPADMNECRECYAMALENYETPSVLCLSRQTLAAVETTSSEKTRKGAYIISEPEAKAALTIIGTGGELGMCVDAAKILNESGISTRVVSMPCQDVFVEQDIEYQTSVLSPDVPCLSVEASSVHGWHRFSHGQIGMTRFGASAPYKDLATKFGFTVDNIVSKSKELVKFYEGSTVPNLLNRPTFDSVVSGGH